MWPFKRKSKYVLVQWTDGSYGVKCRYRDVFICDSLHEWRLEKHIRECCHLSHSTALRILDLKNQNYKILEEGVDKDQ